MENNFKIALVGNPNTGKSTLFNLLTGLNQKIGNFPGVTVDRKTGETKLPSGRRATIIDLPGCYSLNPKSNDEAIVFEVLANKLDRNYPDLIVLVADATNLRRNLLLFSQVADLGIPMVLALNMSDLANVQGIDINVDALAQKLGVLVVPISARNDQGIEVLKKAIENTSSNFQPSILEVKSFAPEAIEEVKSIFKIENDYIALQFLNQHHLLTSISEAQHKVLETIATKYNFNSKEVQSNEVQQRYRALSTVLSGIIKLKSANKRFQLTEKIDSIVTHKVYGLLIFLFILFVIFNAIFSWASVPMDLIENGFMQLAELGKNYLPPGVLTDLLLDGVLAGIGGIVIFIPQIAILFAFISILEDTGYMARVTFMMDKIMRKVGLSGKSVVPLIGGFACAVPSIMSARTIENSKDRIITIMVTPLVSCSARLPVYILLISLVIPSETVWGFINLQGLALMVLYVISLVMALVAAWVMKLVIKAKERSYFIMELPVYRSPRWRNVFLTMFEKSKAFVVQAGKVIIAISIILWVLASYGPADRFNEIDNKYAFELQNSDDPTHIETIIASEKLENSYIGIMGKFIEPVIKPLGYDWKIGIALITSFAAREAFVATMATIYSVDGGEEDTGTIRDKMSASINSSTGLPVYTFATGVSLMLFYAFAMQCMSTVAIVYRETKGWKWPLIQLGYMTALAYVAGLIAYQLLK
ncbi:ferrous iron transport protein B [Pedobacter flavus]|uniref:Ferrous iron transport protein B n=1 Tax=Pedobacter flavus TaxID=3113906 RepID=A0ABU7H2G0_9SPHI|nr:ferrous iron transport protein B [Pedobacter sp. VNH31]MEE1884761.1 ferrous iron transport protein B [Pedobacter sp. VNH31]